MCQYSGWAIRHGSKLYGDVAAPDGPFIHYLHALIQMFVGITDAGFRKGDLFIQVVLSAAMGAALAPRFATGRIAGATQRFAWALLGVALWMSWYLTANWEHTAQRDPYYALFGYLGMVCVYASTDYGPRVGRLLAFVGALLAATQVLTRQSGIIYPCAVALAMLLEETNDPASRRGRRQAAAAGAIAGIALMLVPLLFVGRISGLAFWYFRFPFVAHRFIGKENTLFLLIEAYSASAIIGFTILVGILGSIAVGIVPRRAVGFAVAPLLFLVAACLVGKGWRNHVQQTTAAAHVVLLVLMSSVWRHRAERARWSAIQAAAATGLLVVAGYRALTYLQESPFKRGFDPPVEKTGPEVAKYLKVHTDEKDRVFFYAHDASVLLFAERRPAIPYYVNVIFDIENFLLRQPPVKGEEPSEKNRAAFDRLQADIVKDACGTLEGQPPVAMVFMDNSLNTWGIPTGVVDASKRCTELPRILQENYTEMVHPEFGSYHVYLRNDRRARFGPRG